MTPQMQPLAGLRVLALEQFGAGPYGTMFLADLGAEVIKIENAAAGGDPSRRVGPNLLGDNDSQYFQTWGSWIPKVGQGWAWMSTNPGMIVFPAASIDLAPAGAVQAPTQTMRLSVTTTSPLAMISSPFMLMIRAPLSTTVP